MLAMLAEVTRAWVVATAMDSSHVMTLLATKTFTQDAAASQDSAALCAKDMEDWATLAEREALERVLRVEVANAATLASAREDAEGFVWKIALP
jgi:hypothetical protein